MESEHSMDTVPDQSVDLRSQIDLLKSIDNIAYSSDKSSSTARSDEQVIARFGKKQQFKRNFNLLTVIALSSTCMNSWVGMLTGLQLALFNGGSTGLLISTPIVSFGVLMQALVVAELSSMIPLSGGQYNWVAILAPPRMANFLAYITGWMLIIAWQAAAASITYQVSNVIVALASAVHPEYVAKNWHVALVCCAVIALAVFATTVLGRILPTIESVAFVIFVLGFFVMLVVLTYLAPKLDGGQVFRNYFNGGGWGSNGEAVVVGSVCIMYGFNGFDAGVHIAEEVQNAATVIPKATVISVVLYFIMEYSMTFLILFCFTLEEVMTSMFTVPVVGIFQSVVKSNGGTAALTSLLIAMLIFGAIGVLATASRMLWAFAREDGVPGSRYISRIEPRSRLPLYSIAVSGSICILLALIGLGSTAAFNALTGLTVAAFYTPFIVSASTMLYRRLTIPTTMMPWGPFRLGPLGVPITVVAILYSVVGLIFSFWPPVAAVTLQTFNWSLVVFLGVLFISVSWWGLRARKTYQGPKMEISREQWLELFRFDGNESRGKDA